MRVDELEDAPIQLIDHVRSLTASGDKTIGRMIWVSCEGSNPADKENIGDLAYLPRQGFPVYFYPFSNVMGYRSPFVFVRFNNPKSEFEVLTQFVVYCQLQICSFRGSPHTCDLQGLG